MALTQVDQGLLSSGAQYTGFKNRIINGNMVIDQRNAGAAVTPTTDNYYTLDRWIARLTQASKYSIQQVSDAPAGFINSLKITSLSSYSVTASDYFQIGQYVEGLNAIDLMWGTANAQPASLSFWVKSSIAGTFGGTVFGYATGAPSYPFSYTINSANVWEQKTITIAGPTSGNFQTNNSGCFTVLFSFGVGSSLSGTANTWNYSTLYRAPTGSTSVVGTNGATFQLTGVQFEKGSVATSFDYRDYGRELIMCQRYYQKSTDMSTAPANGLGDSRPWVPAAVITGGCSGRNIPFPVVMRTAPTMIAYSALNANAGVWQQFNGSAWSDYNPGIGADYRSWSFDSTYSIVSGRWAATAEL